MWSTLILIFFSLINILFSELLMKLICLVLHGHDILNWNWFHKLCLVIIHHNWNETIWVDSTVWVNSKWIDTVWVDSMWVSTVWMDTIWANSKSVDVNTWDNALLFHLGNHLLVLWLLFLNLNLRIKLT